MTGRGFMTGEEIAREQRHARREAIADAAVILVVDVALFCFGVAVVMGIWAIWT